MNQTECRAYISTAYPELLVNFDRIAPELFACELFQKESMDATVQLLQFIANKQTEKSPFS